MLCFASLACLSQNSIDSDPLYQRVLPGSASIDLEKIEEGVISYKKFRGKMTHHLSEIGSHYKLFIEFVVNAKEAPDTVYFDKETLAFERRHFYNAWGKYTGKLRFENDKLIGEITPDETGSQLQEQLVFNKQYDFELFEPAMLNYIIGALPLSMGFSASLPMLDLNKGSELIWANIKVEGEEIVKSNGNQYETWRVTSYGSRNKIFWIDKHRNVMVKMQNEGVKFNWKLSE
ncbi:MAG: hypothetical protein ABJP45_03925 [Cyclobacteriaceae bacterium]